MGRDHRACKIAGNGGHPPGTSAWLRERYPVSGGVPVSELAVYLEGMGGGGVCVCIWGQASKPVELGPRERVSNTVVNTLNVLQENGEIMCGSFQKKRSDQCHEIAVLGGARLPYVDNCLVVAVDEEPFPCPLFTPGVGCCDDCV